MEKTFDSSQCAVRESTNIALINRIIIDTDNLKNFKDILDKSIGSSSESKGKNKNKLLETKNNEVKKGDYFYSNSMHISSNKICKECDYE